MNNTNVIRDGNDLTITKMNHPAMVSKFLRGIYTALKQGYKDFNLFF